MNKIKIKYSLLALALLAVIPAYARYDDIDYHKGYRYNPSTVETKKGVVASIEYTDNQWHRFNGIHAVLKSGDETLVIYLGPREFTDDKIKLEVGDKLEVTGSLIDDNGIRSIVAREIKKGNSVLVLRKNDGTPVWIGRGMRGNRW